MGKLYVAVASILACCTSYAQFSIDANTNNLTRGFGETWWFDEDGSGNSIVVSNINAVAVPDGPLPGWAWTRSHFMVASNLAVSEAAAADVVTDPVAAGPGDLLAPGPVATTITNDLTVGSLTTDEDVFIGDGATVTLDQGGLMFRGGNHDIRTPSGGGAGFLTSSYTSGSGTNELFVTVADNGTVYQVFGIEIVDDGADPVAVIVDGFVATDEGEVRFSDENAYSGGTIVNRVSCWGANADCFGTGPVTVRDNNGQAYLVTSSGTFTNDFYIAGNGWEDGFFGEVGALRFSGNAKLAGNIILTGDARIGITSSVNTPARIEGTISGPFDLEKYEDGKIILAGTGHTYSNTTVSGGVLQLGEPDQPVSLPAGSTTLVASGAELQGFTDYDGTVDLYGTLTPGFVHLPETMVLEEAIFRAGSTIQIDLSVEAKDMVELNDLTIEGGTVDLNVIGELNNGTYVIMTYTNLSGAPGALALTGDTGRRTAVLDTGTPGQIRVNVSGSTPPLGWKPPSGNLWDLNTTTNWQFGPIPTATATFKTADPVVFSHPGAHANVVDLVGALTPGVVFVAGSSNYTFAGTGRLIGNGDLFMNGTGTLTINNDNDGFGNVYDTYQGEIHVTSGTLIAGHGDALGDRSVGTFIASGATLDTNGKTLFEEPITVAGAGVGGLGAIVNNGAHDFATLWDVTLTNDTTLGGTFTWDIGSNTPAEPGTLSTGGQPFNLTKVGPNQVGLRIVDVDPALWEIDVEEGLFSFWGNAGGLGDPTGPMIVRSNATFFISNPNNPAEKIFQFKDGGMLKSQGSGSVIEGEVQLEGTVEFDVGGHLTVNAPITMSGGLHKTGSSFLTLTATNSTYSGLTFIDNGQLWLGNGTPGGSFGTGPVEMDFGTVLAVHRTTDASILNPILITGSGGAIELFGTNDVEFGTIDMTGVFSTALLIGYPGHAPRLHVTTNSNITIGRVWTAVNAGTGHILQTGGTLNVTKNEFIGPLRLGYFAGGTNVYDLVGGLLTIPVGGIDVGFHADGLWNISGGTARVAKVDLNGFDSTGSGTLNLIGGDLEISAGGITNIGVPYAFNFSGGTLRAYETNFTVSVDTTLEYAPFVDTGSFEIHFTGDLGGGGGFRKVGAGTMVVSGLDTYGGVHAVFEGTLQQDGTHLGAGLCLVNNDGVLSGSGSTDGNVTIDPAATLAPSPELTIQGELLMKGTYAVDVSGPAIDQTLDIATLTFTTGSVLTVSGTLTEPSYVIMTYTTRTGVFSDTSSVLTQGYHVEYDDGAGEVRLAPHDAPSVGIMNDGGLVTISWPGYAGFDYCVEYRTNMLVGSWELYEDYTNLVTDFGFLYATNASTNATSFFRIQEKE